MDNEIYRRYKNIQIHKTKIYEKTLHGKQCEDYLKFVILNCEDTLGSTSTE